ncbi:unnamed protein product [marine sediment metagenome]|uniref:HTH cro/C1-type domain-containing protein n=1 Tax=marine sediment metagenome TaxID=412755 RepID=X1JTX8_9ZZZZ
MSRKKSYNSEIFNIGLGNRIEERLSELLGKTQKELAKIVNVTENMIKRWKQGTEPGAYKAQKMSEYLECNLTWLLTGKGAKILIEEESEHQDRKTYRRNEDKGLIEFRDKFIHWFVDVSNSHSHIWEEVK